MLLEKSFQAQMLIPMAISLGFGVLFSTLITLLMIPAIYVIADDLIQLSGVVGRWRQQTKIDSPTRPRQPLPTAPDGK